MRRHPKQLSFEDHRKRSGWGGPREGAERRASSKRPPVHHVKRSPLPRGAPAHVTLRVRSGLPSLRSRRFLTEFCSTLRQACERGDFRVVHYSVQRNHVHLLIEATGKRSVRTRLRAAQHPEALDAGTRCAATAGARRRIFGPLVRRLEGRNARRFPARTTERLAAPNLAAPGRVAATRTGGPGGGAGITTEAVAGGIPPTPGAFPPTQPVHRAGSASRGRMTARRLAAERLA
jgi:hypothetical protein